ncbi:MAG: hypothetical protein K6U88_08710 [Dehalococcoidia bacterium]|nr:hypothetical protein [Dehalococcoidia bacterium]
MLLGPRDTRWLINEVLGYHDIRIPERAFERDTTWDEMLVFVDRLGRRARALGLGFGIKLTNTLIVENHGTFFPASAREIAEAYGRASAAFTEALRQQWTDATLSETRNMYGQVWTGAEVLSSLVRHQIHHRGQMTVLMRQAGLGVPGVYGPSKDEWAAMGMPAPEV